MQKSFEKDLSIPNILSHYQSRIVLLINNLNFCQFYKLVKTFHNKKQEKWISDSCLYLSSLSVGCLYVKMFKFKSSEIILYDEDKFYVGELGVSDITLMACHHS